MSDEEKLSVAISAPNAELWLMLEIRRMEEKDIEAAALVHAAAFPRQTFSKDWVTCGFKAFPKIQYFVACLMAR